MPDYSAAAPNSTPSQTSYWDTVFDVIPFPLYVVDVGTLELVNVNRAMRTSTGALAGQTCHEAVYQQKSPCIFCKINELMNREQPIGATVVFEHFNDVDDCWYQLQETLTWRDGRLIKYSIAVDISSLKEVQNALAEAHADLALKNRELERVAITDRLTGLFNRRKLDEVFEHELGRVKRFQEPLSVIIGDIDKFKSVNDTYGHQVGDRILQVVAEIFKHGIRDVDTVGRWGGEEFLIICPNTDLAGAGLIANRLRRTIASYEFPTVLSKTCSFGVAQYQGDESIDELIARADSALYRAKQNGRNRVEFADGAPLAI